MRVPLPTTLRLARHDEALQHRRDDSNKTQEVLPAGLRATSSVSGKFLGIDRGKWTSIE